MSMKNYVVQMIIDGERKFVDLLAESKEQVCHDLSEAYRFVAESVFVEAIVDIDPFVNVNRNNFSI